MTRLTILLLIGLAALLAAAAPASAADDHGATTPVLIDRAVERGEIDRATGALYLARALRGQNRIPERFRSQVPFDATLPLRRLEEAARTLPESRERTELRALMRVPKEPGDPIATRCSVLSVDPKVEKFETEHFFIEYNTGEVQGLTVQQYADALEATWAKEVEQYGWARPPLIGPETPANPPLDKYHVRIGELTPVIFGFVSNQGTYAGEVGDNPHTPWEEEDSQASCMTLNRDFRSFGDARAALEATVAHEFLHSIQYAYGGLTGEDDPDLNFSEGHATWMEDEVFDGANDNARYLYPDFRESMGDHDGDEYSYWFVWRGLVERYGTNVPGASEDVWQRFWEASSMQQASHLDAVRSALATRGITLEQAYHDFAVGARFVKDCTSVLAPPFCFEEATLYRTTDDRGTPESDASIDQVGGTHGEETGAVVEDNFALNWVDLPRDAQPYDVTLENRSAGSAGRLRLSVACDVGNDLRRTSSGVALAASATSVRFNPSGCLSRPVAVITNETQTATDPETETNRAYVLRTAPAPPEPAPTAAAAAPAPAASATSQQQAACTTPTTLRRATATAARRRRAVRIGFARPAGRRVTVDIFQHATGRTVVGERLVARFANRRRAFTWNGRANRRGRRVADGLLSVRFTVRRADGTRESQRRTLRRSRGRFAAARAFDRPESCGAVRAFKLLRPAFGGRANRSNEVTFVLGGEARVRLEVLRRGRVVLRRSAGTRSPSEVHRLRVDSERLPRGVLEFRLTVQGPGSRPIVERLYARRL